MSNKNNKLDYNSGIALAPILFIIAMLAIIGAVIAAGGNSNFSSASTSDRITADIASQANLIRSKINECNLKYGTNLNFDGYPSSLDLSNNVAPVLVSNLACEGDPASLQNVWSGARPTTLPPPTAGFGPWYYVNTNATGLGGVATNGRCIYTSPTDSNPIRNSGLVAGLTKAASKFNNSSTYSDTAEVTYNPASSSQKFVLWITFPSASGTPDPNCVP